MKLWQKALVISTMFTLVMFLAISCGDDKGTAPEPQVPTVTTAAVTEITRSTAQIEGNYQSQDGGAVTACGLCWSMHATPTLADSSISGIVGTGVISSSISGLACSTTYYIRAYATNSVGTGYGNTVSFTTLDSAYTFSDGFGNEYRAISIGTQVWMTENLKTTQYRNGDHIPYVSDNGNWVAETNGALCYYDNDPAYLLDAVGPYGYLYNWYAVNDSRGLAPEGWHIPGRDEWQTLVDYLGGTTVAGGKLKDTGLARWDPPNFGATNESGFTALPAGVRDVEFLGLGELTSFWSSTIGDDPEGYAATVFYYLEGVVIRDDSAFRGYSVRCVMD